MESESVILDKQCKDVFVYVLRRIRLIAPISETARMLCFLPCMARVCLLAT